MSKSSQTNLGSEEKEACHARKQQAHREGTGQQQLEGHGREAGPASWESAREGRMEREEILSAGVASGRSSEEPLGFNNITEVGQESICMQREHRQRPGGSEGTERLGLSQTAWGRVCPLSPHPRAGLSFLSDHRWGTDLSLELGGQLPQVQPSTLACTGGCY